VQQYEIIGPVLPTLPFSSVKEYTVFTGYARTCNTNTNNNDNDTTIYKAP